MIKLGDVFEVVIGGLVIALGVVRSLIFFS